MAVNVGQRHIKDTPFNNMCYAVDAAKKLAIHTVTICSNPKIFMPTYHYFTNRLIDQAVQCYLLSYEANEIRVKDDFTWRTRKLLQEQAIKYAKELLPLINASQKIYHLTSKKTIYWANLAVNTVTLLEKWYEGDCSRLPYGI